VTYLLDVNVLLALRYESHIHHQRASRWLEELRSGERQDLILASCAITEGRFCFLPDALSAERLPSWVTKSKQTTDGHLVQLASTWGAKLATLDTGIPGAVLIPELPEDVNGVREPQPAYGAAA
jgi:hypothetical protein